MKKIKVAINGFGRIGRSFLRAGLKRPEIEILAINDLGDLANLAYLLKHDSAYHQWPHQVEIDKEKNLLIVDGQEIKFFQEKEPKNLPWADLGIEIVVESTGVFTSYQAMKSHLEAGAKRVVLSAPAKGEGEGKEGRTILMGINEEELKNFVLTSNGSCTTNSVACLAYILSEKIGIEKAILNTIHAYTATQRIVDGPAKKDWRRGRAGAVNLIPTTTGAATTVTKVVKNLENLFDGLAIRTPVLVGSLSDFTFLAKKKVSKEEVVDILYQESQKERWQGILKVSFEPLVSTDIVGDPYPCIVDAGMTKVIDGNLVKILAWYDNEEGYTQTLLTHIIKAGSFLS